MSKAKKIAVWNGRTQSHGFMVDVFEDEQQGERHRGLPRHWLRRCVYLIKSPSLLPCHSPRVGEAHA